MIEALSNRPRYVDNSRPPLLKLVPKDVVTVLDVGCNEGGFGAALKKSRPMEIWGVEPDLISAIEAGHKLDHVVQDTFNSQNPIPDNYFDLITFNDSLEHMPDPVIALNLARKKLNANGKILCCVPNMRHIECIEHLLLERDWRYEEMGIRDRTHLRFFTRKSIERLFLEMNFEVIDVNFINDEWWEKGRLLRRMIFRLFPNHTYDMRFKQIVVLAK